MDKWYAVFERFSDGKSYCLRLFNDLYEAECWVENNPDATRALEQGKAWMEIRGI